VDPAEVIVVGVDGSAGADAAVRWAAARAGGTGASLRLLYACPAPVPAPAMPLAATPYGIDPDAYAQAAEAVVAAAADLARQHADRVEVSTELQVGGAGQALIDASSAASLVVVGSRGLGGFTGLLLGSVGVQVSAHAHCPTVVVRGDGTPVAGPVVVGVDGSEPSHAAVGFAFAEASRMHTDLVALHAWQLPLPGGVGEAAALALEAGLGREMYEDAARQMLTDAVAPWRDRYRDVLVRQQTTQGGAAPALLTAAERAAMLVVGTRGHGGFAGLLLGCTSHALLHHATCPVAVIRAPSAPAR
jgi:nucleotide-binding universal stress UspA family protein